MGLQRARATLLGHKVHFPWKRHTLVGKLVMIGFLGGLLVGTMIVTRMWFSTPGITGAPLRRGPACLPPGPVRVHERNNHGQAQAQAAGVACSSRNWEYPVASAGFASGLDRLPSPARFCLVLKPFSRGVPTEKVHGGCCLSRASPANQPDAGEKDSPCPRPQGQALRVQDVSGIALGGVASGAFLSKGVPARRAQGPGSEQAGPGEETALGRNWTRIFFSGLLRLAYSLTVWSLESEGGRWHRSAASAGGLYPCELYAAVPGIGEEVRAGLHHYAPDRQGLTRGLTMLRSGDAPGYAARLCGFEGRPAMVFFVAAVFHRTAWRYGERGYRYALQDAGHLVENLLLALAASGFAVELRYNFEDKSVNELLCLDPRREDCLAVVAAYGEDRPGSRRTGGGAVPRGGPPIPGRREHHGRPGPAPAGAAGHARSDYGHGDHRSCGGRGGHGGVSFAACSVRPFGWRAPASPPSPPGRRRYAATPPRCWPDARGGIFWPGMSWTPGSWTPCWPCSAPGQGPRSGAWGLGCWSGAAGALAPGLYYLDREERTLVLAREGEFTGRMADICLEQRFLARAGVQFCLLADLEYVERSLGPRGYRNTLLTAGRLGQRLYLAGGNLGLGCCGVGAFYDTEAATLLGLGDTVRLLYLQAVGLVPG